MYIYMVYVLLEMHSVGICIKLIMLHFELSAGRKSDSGSKFKYGCWYCAAAHAQ